MIKELLADATLGIPPTEAEIHEERVTSSDAQKLATTAYYLRKLMFNFEAYAYSDESTLAKWLELYYIWLEYLTSMLDSSTAFPSKSIDEAIALTAEMTALNQFDSISGRTYFGQSSSDGSSAYSRSEMTTIQTPMRDVYSNQFLHPLDVTAYFSELETKEATRVSSFKEIRKLFEAADSDDDQFVYIHCLWESPFSAFSDVIECAKKFKAYAEAHSMGTDSRTRKNKIEGLYLRADMSEECSYVHCVANTDFQVFLPSSIEINGITTSLAGVSAPIIQQTVLQQDYTTSEANQDQKNTQQVATEMRDYNEQLFQKAKRNNPEPNPHTRAQDKSEQLDFSLPPQEFLFSLLKDKKYAFDEPWKRQQLRKTLVYLNRFVMADPLEKQRFVDALSAKVTHNYTDLFREGSTEPDVYMTRSGTSANATALQLVSEVLESDPVQVTYFKNEGWYFESKPHQDWEPVEVADARVFLLSIEPNPPQKNGAESFYEDRSSNLARFLQSVQEHPDEKFMLIVDKTNDLLENKYIDRAQLPQNLLLIESASITKHQRGGRSEFLGVVSVWNASLPSERVEAARNRAMGNLPVYSLTQVPLLRYSEVVEQRQQFGVLQQVITEEIENEQRHLPPEERWQWQPYGMFGFMLPPKNILELKEKAWYKEYFNGEKFRVALGSFFRMHKDGMGGKFDKGDSFGLNTTRITHFTIPWGDDRLSCLRIGFGRYTQPEEMRVFIQHVLSELV